MRILVPISKLLRAVVTKIGAAPELPVPPIVMVPDCTGCTEKVVINKPAAMIFLLFNFISLFFSFI
jgi:hypothetical protein